MSLEPPAARTITIELSADADHALRHEYEWLSYDVNPRLAWDQFLHACLAIGLERIQRMPAQEALDGVAAIEG